MNEVIIKFAQIAEEEYFTGQLIFKFKIMNIIVKNCLLAPNIMALTTT